MLSLQHKGSVTANWQCHSAGLSASFIWSNDLLDSSAGFLGHLTLPCYCLPDACNHQHPDNF